MGASTTFGVTTDEVLEKVPMGDQITSTTQPVSTGDVSSWIDEGAATIAALVRKQGQDPTDLSTDAEEQCATAVRAYAAKEVIQSMGGVDEKWRQYKEKYRNLKEEIDDDPAKLDGYQATVPSNIDTSSNKPEAEFIGTDYEF